MYQHPSDWHNNTGIIRPAEEQGMGIMLMRPLTSGVFQRLISQALSTARRAGCGPLAAQLCGLGPVRRCVAGGRARTCLSERELEILRLVADGQSNKQIARQLCNTVRTSSSHVGNILHQLQVASRVEVVMWARKEGIAS